MSGWRYQPKPKENEAQAAKEILHRLEDEPAIVIADRDYASINLIEHFNRAPNVDFIIRVNNDRWKELEGNGHIRPISHGDLPVETVFQATRSA